MEPFGLALGINCAEFRPWRELFFSRSDSILLVEGETDKEYFELLRNDAHGSGRFQFSGEIFPYSGKDTLKQTVLLKFIKDRYKRFFVTYDLDAAGDVEKTLLALGLQSTKQFTALGIDAPGKRDIEGLLPDKIKNAVRTANAALVDQAMNGSSEERRTAKRELKKLYLEEFKAHAKPGEDYYGQFYKFSRLINRAMSGS